MGFVPLGVVRAEDRAGACALFQDRCESVAAPMDWLHSTDPVEVAAEIGRLLSLGPDGREVCHRGAWTMTAHYHEDGGLFDSIDWTVDEQGAGLEYVVPYQCVGLSIQAHGVFLVDSYDLYRLYEQPRFGFPDGLTALRWRADSLPEVFVSFGGPLGSMVIRSPEWIFEMATRDDLDEVFPEDFVSIIRPLTYGRFTLGEGEGSEKDWRRFREALRGIIGEDAWSKLNGEGEDYDEDYHIVVRRPRAAMHAYIDGLLETMSEGDSTSK